MENKPHGVQIAFVILHYNTLEETASLIDSITCNIDTNDYAIVIVDNASPNGTGKILQETFSHLSNYHTILSKENLGFARGNNLGIDFARKELNATFICCMNNDIIMEEKHLSKKLSLAYKKSHFAILGPRIIDKNNHIVTGFPKSKISIKKLTHYVESFATTENAPRGIVQNSTSFYQRLKAIKPLRAIVRFIKDLPRNLVLIKKKFCNRFLVQHNVLLHGCCMIFSPIFFQYYSGFCDKTFMFFEEEILFAMLRVANLHTIYMPSILVKHMEEAASNTAFNTSEERRQFRHKYCSESLQILRDYIAEHNLKDCL